MLRIGNNRKRESALSFYGPLSLILLLGVWAASMVVGFGFIFYAMGSPFHDLSHPVDFRTDIYVSGTTIFTLGLGDVTPQAWMARAVIILESGTGLGLLAVVMGYFPVLYSAFSRREVSISLLDAAPAPAYCSRADSPPVAGRRRTGAQRVVDGVGALVGGTA